MRFLIGKFFELLGLLVVGMGLLAGLGITPTGEASMGKQMTLLCVGGAIFVFGWLLENSVRDPK
jgi:hypothetical protein